MTGPLILITLGVLLLLNNLDPERFQFGRMWPVILIVIGLVKILEYFGQPGPADRQAADSHRARPHRGAATPHEPAPGPEVRDDRAEEGR